MELIGRARGVRRLNGLASHRRLRRIANHGIPTADGIAVAKQKGARGWRRRGRVLRPQRPHLAPSSKRVAHKEILTPENHSEVLPFPSCRRLYRDAGHGVGGHRPCPRH